MMHGQKNTKTSQVLEEIKTF